MGKHYTKDEDDFIRKYYAPGKAKDIGGLLNRAPKAIMNRAWVLGITKKRKSSDTLYSVPVSAPKMPRKERPIKAAQFIKDNYTKLTNEEISKVTGWKIKSITICASKLGLKKPKHLKQIINQWGGHHNKMLEKRAADVVYKNSVGASQSGISLDNNFGKGVASPPKPKSWLQRLFLKLAGE